jgi:hypothetical protein
MGSRMARASLPGRLMTMEDTVRASVPSGREVGMRVRGRFVTRVGGVFLLVNLALAGWAFAQAGNAQVAPRPCEDDPPHVCICQQTRDCINATPGTGNLCDGSPCDPE